MIPYAQYLSFPFGEVLSGGAVSRFDSEGKEYSSVVGDYDFNFRKFCVRFGIFCQPDTLIQNVYDPQSLNHYSFEKNNPYKFIDSNGHIYWGALAGATLGLISSIGLGVTGVGLSIAGVPASVAPPLGAGLELAAVTLGTIGFANAGKSAVDAWNAIIENDEYFENDKGGFLATLGYLTNGKKGQLMGSTIELGISLGFLPSTIGASTFSSQVGGIIDVMDLALNSLSFRSNVAQNAQLANNLQHVANSNLDQSSKVSVAQSMSRTAGNSNIQWYYNEKKGTYQYWSGSGRPSNADYKPVSGSKGNSKKK